MAYSAIADNEIDTDSPLTESLFTRLRDNPLAIAAGLSGAPNVQTAGLEQANGSEAVTAATVRANTLTATEIAQNAIHQSELASSNSEQTNTIGSGLVGFIQNLTGGNHTISAQTKWGANPGTGSYIAVLAGDLSLSYITHAMGFAASSGQVAYVNSRYVTASPPYDLGDGDLDFFLMFCVSSAGDILAAYAAPDPIWVHNGKKHYPVAMKEKKKGGAVIHYTKQKDMVGYGMTWNEAKGNAGNAAAYLDAFAKADDVYVPITAAMKNENMADMPHPFAHILKDHPGSRVVMLDPYSTWMQDYKAMRAHDGFSISDIEQHIDLKAPESVFVSPPGVVSLDARFK